MKIVIPAACEKILNKINENGYEAYIVGGCVRDSLLGRCPSDWDITTSATPYEIKEIFNIFDSGKTGFIKHFAGNDTEYHRVGLYTWMTELC